MDSHRIAVRWPPEPECGGWYTKAEEEAAIVAIRETMHWKSQVCRKYRGEFEEQFATFINVKHAVAVNGAGTGLDIAMRLLNIEPGDEVVSCAINFPGTHLAIIGSGAKLVLCEPDPETLNLSAADLPRRITSKTRAIVVTHMNGLPSDMEEIMEIAERFAHSKHGPLRVIVDAARCTGAWYRGARVGKQGWMTVFSFQRKKLMSTLGEGGMIVTDDESAAKAATRIRGFGDKVSWGSNYHMTDVQAAVGCVQLQRLDEMNQRRIQVATERTAALENCEGILLPSVPSDRTHLHYLYTLLLTPNWKVGTRDIVVERLADDYGVGCAVGNPPTYTANSYIHAHVGRVNMPVAQSVGQRVFCPCLHPLMDREENRQIAAAIASVIESLEDLEVHE